MAEAGQGAGEVCRGHPGRKEGGEQTTRALQRETEARGKIGSMGERQAQPRSMFLQGRSWRSTLE